MSLGTDVGQDDVPVGTAGSGDSELRVYGVHACILGGCSYDAV
jgi:hypothetical protein